MFVTYAIWKERSKCFFLFRNYCMNPAQVGGRFIKKIMDFWRAGKIIKNCSKSRIGTGFEFSINESPQKWICLVIDD